MFTFKKVIAIATATLLFTISTLSAFTSTPARISTRILVLADLHNHYNYRQSTTTTTSHTSIPSNSGKGTRILKVNKFLMLNGKCNSKSSRLLASLTAVTGSYTKRQYYHSCFDKRFIFIVNNITRRALGGTTTRTKFLYSCPTSLTTSAINTSTSLKMTHPLNDNIHTSTHDHDHDYNCDHDLASQIINHCKTHNHNSKFQASITIAGGGASSIHSLTSTSGSSSFFLHGQVLYDRISCTNFLSSSLHLLNGHDADTNHFHYQYYYQTIYKSILEQQHQQQQQQSLLNRHALFSFASKETSFLLASKTLFDSMALVSSTTLSNMKDVLAIGCTSSLVSQSSSTNITANTVGATRQRFSKAFITLCDSHGLTRIYTVGLQQNYNSNNINNDISSSITTQNRRNRQEEEQVIGNLILSILYQYIHSKTNHQNNNNNNNALFKKILNRDGDYISMEQYNSFHGIPEEDNITTGQDIHKYHYDNIVLNAAQSILNGATNSVLLLPNHRSQPNSNITTPTITFTNLVRTILPPYTIIFPGSFNPIHKGHVALARAAIKVMIKKRNKELIDWYDSQGLQTPLSSSKTRSNDIWNTIEHQQYVKKKISSNLEEEKEEDIPLLFEISLMNADKPPIELSQVQQRISFFQDYVATFSQQKNKFNNTNDNIPMPKDWGVVLTNAPLFIDKVKLFKQYMTTSSSFSSYPSGRLTFLIGVDTMIRIINPKYYNQSNDEMLEALYNMQSQGVHFVVGGRLDQKKGTNDTSSETATMPFMTGKEELNALPHDLKGIFTLIAEDDFRVDISSTELRSRTKN